MQRKKKRSIIFELHSIPIKLEKIKSKFSSNRSLCKRLYLVSYSIPLSCVVVLLLGLGMMVNPGLFLVDKTNAVTIQDEWVVKESEDGDVSEDDSTDNSNSTALEDMLNSNNTNDAINNNASDSNIPDDGIMPLADSTINISISGQNQSVATDAVLDEVAYRSQNITVNVGNVQSYSLVISGDSTLTPPAGGAVVNATADGVKGGSLADLTWGYAWGNTSDANANMSYSGVSPTGKNLAGTALSGNQASFTKKLTFAAKFPITAMTGNYVNSTVKLSLIATPVQVVNTWKDASGNPITGLTTTATTMQGIKSGFCKNNDAVKTGYTITLDDVRDNNQYTIVKLVDGNCWMQENLRFNLATNVTLTPKDTDVVSNWTPTKSTAMGSGTSVAWTNNEYIANQADSATFGDKVHGNYYSWCAATAGTCSEALSGGIIAPGSICPKGWGLPANYGNLISTSGVSTGAQLNASPYNFPYAGYVQTGTLSSSGTVGKYWSGTSYDSDWGYRLEFDSGKTGSYIDRRGCGLSVRCVADY